MRTLGAGQAMVVVPAHKARPNACEAVSWDRCLKVFAKTPIALIAPEGLDLTAYVETRPELAFALNGSKLPFGCHWWSKESLINFWRPVVSGYGYDV